ncbi:MAG: serine/threonine protein kinase [Oligosphaeraceae bacterium]|nr:serine/threonine protein kinase [Oligosphaeraceae bacterium]
METKSNKKQHNNATPISLPQESQRKYISVTQAGGTAEEEQAELKIKQGSTKRDQFEKKMTVDRKKVLETQLIDVARLRRRRNAPLKTEQADDRPLPLSSAGNRDDQINKPLLESETPEPEETAPGTDLSRKGLQTLNTAAAVQERLPQLDEQAIAEIRAAAEKGAYELIKPIARGAESILYRARAGGRHIFCVKAIRNRVDGWLGNSKTRGNQERLQDVSYATKMRHLRNEYNVAKSVYSAEPDFPLVKVFAMRRVTRLGIELGWDLLMEYIQGHDLSERNIMRKLPVDDRIRIMYQAVQALEYLHRRRFIHLDIKPSNFMLTREGRVKLIDFGISVPNGYKGRAITGTAGYLSPEQISKETLNEATDIFALGVTFAILFGGRPLNQNLDELLQRSVRQDARYHLESGDVTAVIDVPELVQDRPLIAEIIRNCSILKRDSRIPNCQVLLRQLHSAAKTYGLELE